MRVTTERTPVEQMYKDWYEREREDVLRLSGALASAGVDLKHIRDSVNLILDDPNKSIEVFVFAERIFNVTQRALARIEVDNRHRGKE